ncbi:asb120 [Agrotis segetum nucleopolyhedrovirus B]|uniref:Asb120 n=1 Tax=Agrotis segetum nucleopolyhedrovirus B TaxID=1580580 RepID=A0A0A7KRI6_9ABAC|nr:asb120 [Agrotis segetum nucleopolyhedrovirus B]AIZ48677.1 asb120 [Agrotis segetum nucleopolyhedrovirus B]
MAFIVDAQPYTRIGGGHETYDVFTNMKLILHEADRPSEILGSGQLILNYSFSLEAYLNKIPPLIYSGADQIAILNQLKPCNIKWGCWSFEEDSQAKNFLANAIQYLMEAITTQLSSRFEEITDYTINQCQIFTNE